MEFITAMTFLFVTMADHLLDTVSIMNCVLGIKQSYSKPVLSLLPNAEVEDEFLWSGIQIQMLAFYELAICNTQAYSSRVV